MAKTVRALIFGAVLAAAFVPASASAQDSPRFFAGATGSSISTTSILSIGTAELEGVLVGAEGVILWKRLALRVGYSEGSLGFERSLPGAGSTSDAGDGIVGRMLAGVLSPAPGTTAPSDLELAEGFALLGWNPLLGLELNAGAQIRARINGDESERLLLALVQTRYEAPLFSHFVRGFVEGWTSFAGTASNPDDQGRGYGGAGGMLLQLAPVSLRVTYAVDQARYNSSPRRETFESLRVTLSVMAGR